MGSVLGSPNYEVNFCSTKEQDAHTRNGGRQLKSENFLGTAARFSGGGGGVLGFNLDFELADGEDVELWVVRLRDFLKQAKARPGTVFEAFPEDWKEGMA